MTVHLLSADHRVQGLEAVSRLGGVSAHLGPDLLRAVRGLDGVLVLGTCNRLAILLDAPVGRSAESLCDAVSSFCAERSGIDAPVDLSLWSGRAAYRELFATAAGLESMVIGEREIAGQLRRALILATAEGTVTGAITRAVEHASTVSKRVAATTALAGAGRSVVAVGLDLASRRLPPPEEAGVRALVVGTGAYAGATVTALRNRGICDIGVHSRSERAREFAAGHCVRAVDEDELPRSLALADLVITCRGLGAPVLTRELVSTAMRRRRGAGAAARAERPLVVLDLALSRDVELSVGSLPGVLLIDLPAVQRAVPDVEASQVEAARRMVDEEVARFRRKRAGRRMDPVVRRLRSGVEAVVEEEIARLRTKDGRVDVEEAARALHHLAARLLHHPTVAARTAGETGHAQEYLQALGLVLGSEIAAGLRGGGPPASCPAHGGSWEERSADLASGPADLPTIPVGQLPSTAAEREDEPCGSGDPGGPDGPAAVPDDLEVEDLAGFSGLSGLSGPSGRGAQGLSGGRA